MAKLECLPMVRKTGFQSQNESQKIHRPADSFISHRNCRYTQNFVFPLHSDILTHIYFTHTKIYLSWFTLTKTTTFYTWILTFSHMIYTLRLILFVLTRNFCSVVTSVFFNKLFTQIVDRCFYIIINMFVQYTYTYTHMNIYIYIYIYIYI